MKKFQSAALLTAYILSTLAPSVLAQEIPKVDPERTDRIIVRLKDSSQGKVDKLVDKVDSTASEVTKKDTIDEEVLKVTNTGAQVIVTENLTKEQQDKLVDQLNKDPNVEYAEPDTFVTTSDIDSDILDQVERQDTTRKNQWHIADSGVIDAWKSGYTGKGVVIGINDSGY